MSKFGLRFDRFEGGAYYDTVGTRKINTFDSLNIAFQDTTVRRASQSSFLKTFYDLSFGGNYFITSDLNLKAKLGLRIGSVNETREYYVSEIPLPGEQRNSVDLDPLTQTSLLPARIGIEYYLEQSISSGTFHIIPSIHSNLTFGSASAFEDSTLFANGAMTLEPGLNIGYANQKVYIETAFKYLNRFEEYSDQLYSSVRIEFRNIKKVNFYLNVEDFRVLDEKPNSPYNFYLPQTNDSFTSIEAGAYLIFNRFVGSFYLSQFINGQNTIDRSAYGFSINYIF